MIINELMINFLGITFIITIISLIFILILKMEKNKQLQTSVTSLKKSLNEMDEQAKLIVRTDIELNKTQEELDKKIIGLYALQKLSKSISTALEENQIFNMIENSNIGDLGFEKACGFMWDNKTRGFILHLNIGYGRDEIETMRVNINNIKEPLLSIIQQKKAVSTISLKDIALEDKIKEVFKIIYFVISPIILKEGDAGFLFVGTENTDIAISEGDEELITILANQIGQALENAKLFDKTWKAQQELGKKVEERTHELQIALDEVKIISKRKSDFISAVSHELRTPLTSIKGYASILLTGRLGELPEDVRLRLEKINRHSDELTHLVNDLLDISRIESGRVLMRLEPQNMNSILSGIEDLFSGQFKEKQIEFHTQVEEGCNVIVADLSQTKRVFINLVGNALKFIPEKGAKIEILVHKLKEFAQVDIIDNGCGIPDEAKEKIFEEFYRVENQINEQVKGTGLGLALVKHIIEAHGGRIWVTSQIRQGSTFSWTLPLHIIK